MTPYFKFFYSMQKKQQRLYFWPCFVNSKRIMQAYNCITIDWVRFCKLSGLYVRKLISSGTIDSLTLLKSLTANVNSKCVTFNSKCVTFNRKCATFNRKCVTFNRKCVTFNGKCLTKALPPWRTVDRQGRRQITSMSKIIIKYNCYLKDAASYFKSESRTIMIPYRHIVTYTDYV